MFKTNPTNQVPPTKRQQAEKNINATNRSRVPRNFVKEGTSSRSSETKGSKDLLEVAVRFDPEQVPVEEEAVDMSDLCSFLRTPVPKNITLQCYILRNKEGANKLHPMYELYLTETDEFFLAGRKRSWNKTSNYVISLDKESMEKDSLSYLGKLRSNFLGTEFVLYDNGLNPEKNQAASARSVRKELAGVVYQSNILGSRGPRKMHVLLPKTRGKDTEVFRPPHSTGIIDSFKEGNLNQLHVIANRPPKWNEQVGAYVLNFNGRVTMASVKNFQLIFEEDDEDVKLQFGRVGKDKFTMDVKHPLTAFQAFAICLSSFDYKLACE